MTQLLIIADDLTGAIDSAVGAAAYGARTRVAFQSEQAALQLGGCEVLSLALDTRHLPAHAAYEEVKKAALFAGAQGIPYIFKKTDSALRGNPGAELTALLDASGRDALPFVPAFPAAGRTTVGGAQLIDGVPVADSAFGRDPFEPVRLSYIPAIIAAQSDTPCEVVPCGGLPRNAHGIHIYDCSTDAELEDTAARLCSRGMNIFAGCAGLGAALPAALGIPRTKRPPLLPGEGIVAICGSVNPTARAQSEYAQAHGFTRVSLLAQQLTDGSAYKVAEPFFNDKRLLIDTADSVPDAGMRAKVAEGLGRLAADILLNRERPNVAVIGGDTLRAVLLHSGCASLEPVRELCAGAVLSSAALSGRELPLISKAGGFGSETFLTDIYNTFCIKEN